MDHLEILKIKLIIYMKLFSVMSGQARNELQEQILNKTISGHKDQEFDVFDEVSQHIQDLATRYDLFSKEWYTEYYFFTLVF